MGKISQNGRTDNGTKRVGMFKGKVIDPEKRVDRIKKLMDCKSDSELARRLETQQPQIARWKRGEFSKSMAKLVDYLLLIISNLNRENIRLNNEKRSLKKIAEEGSRKKKEGCLKSEVTFNDLLDRITGGESPLEIRDDIARFLGQMATNYEIHEIKKFLNKNKFPTVSGKRNWTISEIKELIRKT